MGEYFKKINLSIKTIVSSPSCRARQTALLALGEINIIENKLVHMVHGTKQKISITKM